MEAFVTLLQPGAVWAPVLGLVGLLIAMGIYSYVKRQPAGTTAMKDLADQIHEGAMAFLRREYSVLAVFLIIVALLLWWAIGGLTALAFITGALSCRKECRPR